MDADTTTSLLQLLARAQDAAALELVALLMAPYTEVPPVVWMALEPVRRRYGAPSTAAVQALVDRHTALPVVLKNALVLLYYAPLELDWEFASWIPPWKEAYWTSFLWYRADYVAFAKAGAPRHLQSYYYLLCALWIRHRLPSVAELFEALVGHPDLSADTHYQFALHCLRTDRLSDGEAALHTYLRLCPAHFPLVEWSFHNRDLSYCRLPSTPSAYARLAQLYECRYQQPQKALYYYEQAIACAPQYPYAPHLDYIRLLEQQEGKSPRTIASKENCVKQLERLELRTAEPLYRTYLQLAEECWVVLKDEQRAKRYYLQADRMAYRSPRRQRRLFYQLFRYRLYGVVLYLCEERRHRYHRPALRFATHNRRYTYFEAKALEKKIKLLLDDYRDYWQAHRLVKQWRQVQPQSRRAQHYEAFIKDQLPY